MSVFGNALEAEHLTQFVEEHVIRASQGVVHILARMVAHVQFGVRSNDAFAQRGQRHHGLEG